MAGGRLQAIFVTVVVTRRVLGGRKHPDPSECVSLRGAMQKRGSWSVQVERRGLQSLRKTPNRRPWGARDSFEEGNLHPPRHAASHAGQGEVLRSGYLGSREGLSSFQPAVAASDDWIDAPSASGAPKSGDLRGSNLAACLQRRVASSVALCVTHCPPPLREGGLRKSCDFERGRTMSEGERVDQAVQRRGYARGEDGSLVGCARASSTLVAEVGRRCPDSEKRVPSFHPKGR